MAWMPGLWKSSLTLEDISVLDTEEPEALS